MDNRLIASEFDPAKTEVQNMNDNGYFRVFDCGNAVFDCGNAVFCRLYTLEA